VGFAVPFLVELGGAEAVIGGEVDDAASVGEEFHDDVCGGAVWQAGHCYIGTFGDLFGVEVFDGQADTLCEGGVHVGEHAPVSLSTGCGDDFDLRVSQEPFDGFECGVAGGADDCGADFGLGHRVISKSVEVMQLRWSVTQAFS